MNEDAVIEHTWEYDRPGSAAINCVADNETQCMQMQAQQRLRRLREAHCSVETHATGTEDGEREESLSRDGDKKTGPAPFILLARFRIWMTSCPSCIRIGFLSVTKSIDKLWDTGALNKTVKQHALIDNFLSLASYPY